MAINWLFALKVVPWADVVQAAPAIVKGARKLFDTARASRPIAGREESYRGQGDDDVHARLRQIEIALQKRDAEQDAGAELIRSLAEQHARVVAAIELMRARMRVLFGISIGLTVVLIAITVWLVTR
ncbi:MAG: hypothetical protein IT530_12810 [Burkholderiales bacterium]|nr:hypothetical protein [Burkholderiales bacterium]